MTKAFKLLRSALMMVLSVVLLGDVGCNRATRINTTPFPASDEVKGWARTDDIRTFVAADLWKYIDGEAERYLKAGALRVLTADYRLHGIVDVVVDVYVMGNAEGATKIYDSEPTSDSKSVQLGDAGRLYNQSLAFHKGSYLVRIVAYQESAEIQPALLELGGGIERRLTR